VAIVAWGENGHIYTRRMWGTAPSVVYEQADVPTLDGLTEVSADQPAIGAGGDSSYTEVVFREVLTNGSQQQTRVLANRLHGSVFDGITQPDGLSTPAASSAAQPAVAVGEYGRGVLTSTRTDTDQVWATQLGTNEVSGGAFQLDSLANASPPYATAGLDGVTSYMVAWQHDPGPAGTTEIRARYYDGTGFGPELIISSPEQGPTDAASGLFTAGDASGDAAAAWVQGAAGAESIVTAQLYQPPGSFAPQTSFAYVRTVHPTLAWSAARSLWGLQYVVSVDGAEVAQTSATSIVVPAALSEGPHTWQVQALNAAGLTSVAPAATVFVATIPPAVTFTLTGKLRVHAIVHVEVSYSDVPPGLPPADASGVTSVVVDWGDGSRYRITHGKYHVYRRAGRYRLTVTVTDRAGNVTTVSQAIKIAAPKPTRKPHKRRKP
jgi:hypothetical protein